MEMESRLKKEINLLRILRSKIWREKVFRFILALILGSLRLGMLLRYRIQVKGKKEIDSAHFNPDQGIVFLPNHPAEIDPMMLMVILWKHYQIRPLVIEYFFYIPLFRFCLQLVRALPVPSAVSSSNRWKVKQVEALIEQVAGGLKNKNNFLIYPAGQLKRGAEEVIGGASLIHYIFSINPNVNVVLVRITGLWGSRFSRAITGEVPSLKRNFLDGFKIVLKNAIFFTPRRKILIEMEKAPEDFPRTCGRSELNKYLESWYNHYPKQSAEPLYLVSSCFWKTEVPDIYKESPCKDDLSKIHIPKEAEENIFHYLASFSHHSVDEIEREMHLSRDLGLDSLDVANLYFFLSEHYGVGYLPHGELRTVEDLLKAAFGQKLGREESVDNRPIDSKWVREKNRKSPEAPSADHISKAFLMACDRMKKTYACADAFAGSLTYQDLKRKALTLAMKIKELSGSRIGILLPSSVSASTVILACLLAKKVPVMLNWRSGSNFLQKALDLTQIQVVISSYKFLGKLENAQLEPLEEHFLFLEDLLFRMPFRSIIFAWWISLKREKGVSARLGLKTVQAADEAVVLFTSGTESMPKAVPLTHQNLLNNQNGAFLSVKIQNDDVFYCLLPPFHSFGFSITSLMPILFGIKACYAPDPTDTFGVIDDISNWRPTIFCCPPSLIKSVFRLASPEQFHPIRLFISGAEKTPTELYDYVSLLGPNCRLIEGYGITECGPVVTVSRPDVFQEQGVGKPVPGVELCIIDIDTQQTLGPFEEGEVCIRGPGVFKGYLNDLPAPFCTIGNKEWYRSGDMGYLDAEGHLFLLGRSDRVIKISGESVSLGRWEDELDKIAKEKKWRPSDDGGPFLVLSVRERHSERPQIILFTTLDVTKEQINKELKARGFTSFVKIGEVRRLEQIPLTGTGKTHYRLLDEMNID